MLVSRRGRQLIGCALVVLTFSLVQATAASAQQRAGTFGCSATVVRVGAINLAQANPQFSPCADDRTNVPEVFIPLGTGNHIRVLLLEALTESNPSPTAVGTQPFRGHGGGAQAGVAGAEIKIGSVTIGVAALRSRVAVVCQTHAPPFGPGDPPTMSGFGDLVVVRVNSTRFAANQPLTVPVPGVGTLYLNREVRTSNSLTRRAVELDRPGTASDIVIAESRVGFTGNPCTTA